MKITVASAQHIIQAASDFTEFSQQCRQQMASLTGSEVKLAVFAEYGSMGLVAALPVAERQTLQQQLIGLQPFRDQFLDLFRELAAQYQCWIVAPSFPFEIAPGYFVNRAWITGPAGQCHYQDKLHMTRFEKEQFDIRCGSNLSVINAGEFQFAVAICYDSEFGQQVQQLCEAGAQIICVPSCTDTQAGYHRVRYSAQARAVENQCFVVQSPLVGLAPWCDAIDVNVGIAGIFSPVDRGFPDDGVVALGSEGSGWVVADCDLAAMAQVRRDGQVLNWQDRLQALPPVTLQQ